MKSAFPEKTVGGNYLDFNISCDEIARYRLPVERTTSSCRGWRQL